MLSKLKIQDQTRLKVAYSVFHNAVINESNICNSASLCTWEMVCK